MFFTLIEIISVSYVGIYHFIVHTCLYMYVIKHTYPMNGVNSASLDMDKNYLLL